MPYGSWGSDASNTTANTAGWGGSGTVIYYTMRSDGFFISTEPPEKTIEELELEADWKL
jgi:hypothetical protein